MEPLLFFGIVLIVAIAIGVFFENFALDVKSGRRRPPTPPPRRPPQSGPGQTKIWRSQLMHAGDKRPKPKPTKGMNPSASGSSQASDAGQTKIWRSQKEYSPDGSPKPKPTQGMRPSSEPGPAQASGSGQTKIWRSQKEYRPEERSKIRPTQGMKPSEQTNKRNSLWGETNGEQSQSNRSLRGGSDESAQTGRWPQGQSANDAAGIRPSHRRPYSSDEQFKSHSRQPKPADRPTPPKAPQRGPQDRPIARPGQTRYSAQRRTQADSSRPNQPVDPFLDTYLGGANQGQSADNRSAKRRYPKSYSADEPTRIQFTDRLRPIDQPRNRPGPSRSLNSASDRSSRSPSQGRQQQSNRAQNNPSPSESFNPADYEQTYIGPFLDEDAIAELKREVDSPPPDVVYQETYLGPFLEDEVIEEIRDDEIEELQLEGDVQPFDSSYYDQTYIGSNDGFSLPEERTYIGGGENPASAPKTQKNVQPLNSEEDSTLIWRRPEEENAND
ncbi:MAG: hypothetical protein MJA27_26200 [Pseudanabaenales cyanobacterium]|nr:hypothetical protein [Pseudanabaenales cyanobacterium]